MNNDDFDKLVSRVFSSKTQLLKDKGQLYGDEDRLSQFKLMSNLSGLTPEQCAFILASKHFTALKNLLFRYNEKLSAFTLDEITGDLINYMLLIQALCEEKLNESAQLGQVSIGTLQCGGYEQQVPKPQTWCGLGEK